MASSQQQNREEGIKIFKNICPICPESDGLEIHVTGDAIVRIEGDRAHPCTCGHICIKGKHANDVLDRKGRIIYPQKKKKSGWFRIGWDEAIDEIADRTHAIREQFGPLAFAASDADLNNVNGIALGLFMRSLGSPNLLCNLDLCAGPGIASDLLLSGDQLTTYFAIGDFRHAKCIFITGSNIAASLPRQWQDTQKAMSEGAKLIVVDPRRTPIAEKADLWLQIRPGSDGALAMGMLNVIINEKLYDEAFVTKHCIGFERLKERVQRYPLKDVAAITWLSPEEIQRAARLYATIKPATLRANLGVTQRNNSFPASQAFTALTAVTGNIDIRGGQPIARNLKGLKSNPQVAAEFPLADEVTRKQIGVGAFPLWAGKDSIVVEGGYANIPMTLKAMVTNEPYPVKAWFIMVPNVVLTYPDTKLVMDAARHLELMVVCTDTMSPTAQLADFILPRAHPFEIDRIVASGYGQWVMAAEKVVPPRGESRDDIQIFHDLAERMVTKGYLKNHFLTWANIEQYNEYRLSGSGYTFEELKNAGVVQTPVKYKKYEHEGFNTPSGKFEFYSSTLEKFGYDPLPAYQESPTSELSCPKLAERYPLLLTSSRRKYQFLSRSPVNQWMREIDPYPELEIHPQTAAERGIKDGDQVSIETPKGRCQHKAKVTDSIHPKVVNGCFGWWFPEKDGPDNGALEANINSVMAYEPPHDRIAGINNVQGVICEVVKVTPHR